MGKIKNKRTVKVWRIFRFNERFELPDDSRFCRKGPLMFIREYVGSGQNDEAINYKRQIAACEASKNRHILISVFSRLRDIAANYSRAYRGYILDENFRPAGINKIAGWIGLGIKEAKKILSELEQIGLLERANMPEFDLSVNDEKGKKQKSRARTRKYEKKRAPLKNKDKSESGNGNKIKKKKSGNIPDKEKPLSKEQSSGQASGRTQSQTATNPIQNPKGSDGQVGHDKQGIRTYPPGQSLQYKYLTTQYKDPQRIGAVLQKLYNPEAEEFALAVYKAIGTRYPQNSREGRSEIACFKQAWARALLAGIGPIYLTKLWDRTIHEAEKLRIKRRVKPASYWTKSPEAVLRDLFDKLLDAMKQQAKADEQKCAIS